MNNVEGLCVEVNLRLSSHDLLMDSGWTTMETVVTSLIDDKLNDLPQLKKMQLEQEASIGLLVRKVDGLLRGNASEITAAVLSNKFDVKAHQNLRQRLCNATEAIDSETDRLENEYFSLQEQISAAKQLIVVRKRRHIEEQQKKKKEEEKEMKKRLAEEEEERAKKRKEEIEKRDGKKRRTEEERKRVVDEVQEKKEREAKKRREEEEERQNRKRVVDERKKRELVKAIRLEQEKEEQHHKKKLEEEPNKAEGKRRQICAFKVPVKLKSKRMLRSPSVDQQKEQQQQYRKKLRQELTITPQKAKKKSLVYYTPDHNKTMDTCYDEDDSFWIDSDE